MAEESKDKMFEARMAGLRKKADTLGVMYTDETEESSLRLAIKEAEAPRSAPPAAQSSLGVNDLGEILKAVKQSLAPEQNPSGIVSERDMDPNDETEERIYFHPALFWKLPMKRVGGQMVKPPFGDLMFKREYGSAVRNGNQNNTRYLCALRTKSKREIAYIETHPQFGRSFFTSHTQAEAMSTKARRGIVFGRYMNSLINTPSTEIYRMAGEMKLSTGLTEDLATLRTRIADALTDRDYDQIEKQEANLLAQSGKKSLLTTADNS